MDEVPNEGYRCGDDHEVSSAASSENRVANVLKNPVGESSKPDQAEGEKNFKRCGVCSPLAGVARARGFCVPLRIESK